MTPTTADRAAIRSFQACMGYFNCPGPAFLRRTDLNSRLGAGLPGATSSWLRQPRADPRLPRGRSEEHTSELQSLRHLVCRLLLEKKKMATVRLQPRASWRALP